MDECVWIKAIYWILIAEYTALPFDDSGNKNKTKATKMSRGTGG